MEEHIVESIPNTMNAEEAMHWRFYSTAGRAHSFMHGMMLLYKIATDFERQFEAVNSTYLPVSIPPRNIHVAFRRNAYSIPAARGMEGNSG